MATLGTSLNLTFIYGGLSIPFTPEFVLIQNGSVLDLLPDTMTPNPQVVRYTIVTVQSSTAGPYVFRAERELFRLLVASCVYTRVLTRVQLTSGREPSSNPPMDVG